jgi:hypothetical protein
MSESVTHADPSRKVYLTNRYGAQLPGDVTVARLDELLDTIAEPDGDDEHRSVSLTDTDEWNLEFYPDTVTFENVEDEPVGDLRGLNRQQKLEVARQFLAGDLDAVRSWGWQR